jgi:DNA-directed RNA polymerase sigma subunit (sigma70/sigma32)
MGSACRTVSGMTEPIVDVRIRSRLTRAEVVELQRAIEAGLLARDVRISGAGFADATEQELQVLEDHGEQARQRFIRANLGLVGMVSRQYAARSRLPDAELFQEGCVGLPACQLPTGSSPCANVIGVVLEWWMGASSLWRTYVLRAGCH